MCPTGHAALILEGALHPCVPSGDPCVPSGDPCVPSGDPCVPSGGKVKVHPLNGRSCRGC